MGTDLFLGIYVLREEGKQHQRRWIPGRVLYSFAVFPPRHPGSMTTVTFDTLKFVEKLKAAGVPEAQAKAED